MRYDGRDETSDELYPGDDPPGGVLYTDTRGEIAALKAEVAELRKNYATSLQLNNELIARLTRERDQAREEAARLREGFHPQVNELINTCAALRAEVERLLKENAELKERRANG